MVMTRNSSIKAAHEHIRPLVRRLRLSNTREPRNALRIYHSMSTRHLLILIWSIGARLCPICLTSRAILLGFMGFICRQIEQGAHVSWAERVLLPDFGRKKLMILGKERLQTISSTVNWW